MLVELTEREITKAELARMNSGFEEHALEYGIQPDTPKRYSFVAMDEDKFIGCSSGLAYYSWFYLSDLWLEKPYRGKGIGKDLLRKLEDRVYLEGIRNIYTWTAAYEAPPFYKGQGYEIFAEFENYFPNGHSHIGFKKALEP